MTNPSNSNNLTTIIGMETKKKKHKNISKKIKKIFFTKNKPSTQNTELQ